MTELARVKTEIKQWERAFRAEHGRDPSKLDMKAANMQDKYKQYKALLVSVQPASNDEPGPVAGPSHRNPFSPKKPPRPPADVKGRQFAMLDDSRVVHNPFATPPKSRRGPRGTKRDLKRRERSPAPDHDHDFDALFPPIAPNDKPAVQDTPATRARKRLRGELVPPSPDKSKRAPSFARATSDPFAAAAAASRTIFAASHPPSSLGSSTTAVNPDADSDEDDDDTVMGESPAKPSSNGKVFRPLFDETPHKAGTLTRSSTMPAGRLFASKDSRPTFVTGPQPKRKQGVQRTASLSVAAAETRPHGKKRSSFEFDEVKEDAAETEELTDAPTEPKPVIILPPSPPPVKATWQPKGKGKGKPHDAFSKPWPNKKPRVDPAGEQTDDQHDSTEDDYVQSNHHWTGQYGTLRRLDDKGGNEASDDWLDDWEQFMKPFVSTKSATAVDSRTPPRPKVDSNVAISTSLLDMLALGSSPVRNHVGFDQNESELVRGLILPDGSSLAARRAGDVFSAGQTGEGDEEPVSIQEDVNEVDWADEGLRWDEAEL